MGTLAELVRDLRTYEQRKDLTAHLRSRFRAAVPPVRQAIKARAVATLPRRGGLNRWVAALRITAKITLSGRRASVQIKGGRNSARGRSDIRRIDKGRVRAPSWGRRGRGAWHNQTVTPGFFTTTSSETDAWRAACVAAMNDATEVIRRG